MTSPRLRSAWPFLALVVLVAALYWPGRGGGFVFDDFPNIVDNAALHVSGWNRHAWLGAMFSSDSGIGHRPLAMLDNAAATTAFGWNPAMDLDEGLRRSWDWYRESA